MIQGYCGWIPCIIIIVVQASLAVPSDFSGWGWLSSVVVGNYLYIDGGENYTYDQATGTRGFTIRGSTRAIDLSTSWTNASVSANSHERPSGMKTSRRPLLWYDIKNNDVYEWSGWTYDGNTNENENWIWTFSPDGHGGSQWNQQPAPATKNSSLSTTFGSSTVYTPTAFYSLGGTLVPPVIQGAQYLANTSIQGLLSFTFSDNTWTNTSSVEFAPSGFSVLGEACFVPNFGKEGLLIFLGGESPPNDTYHYLNATAVIDMATIPVYDIHTGAWYHQVATGDVPPGRTGLCAIGAPTADNSSFEIFIYGGFSNSSEEGLDSATADYEDVFVLSLPAFNWFRAAAGIRRAWPICQLIGGRQMISIGGGHFLQAPPIVPPAIIPDTWTNGIGIFDMTDLSWSSSYNSNAMPYEQSNVVKQYYQSNPGIPTWNDPALAEVFATNTSSKPSSASTTHTPAPIHHGTDIGAIVGGVVGGLAGLCAFLGLAAFFRRRRCQSSFDASKDHNNYIEMSVETSRNELGPSPAHELGPPPVHELGAHDGRSEGALPSPRSELEASRSWAHRRG